MKLKEFRIKVKLSQSQLSKLVSVPFGVLSNINKEV